MPAFARLLLKRRRALSSDSFSFTCTDDIFSYLPSVPLYCRVISKIFIRVARTLKVYIQEYIKVKAFLISRIVIVVIGVLSVNLFPVTAVILSSLINVRILRSVDILTRVGILITVGVL